MGTAICSFCLLPGLWTSPRNWKRVRYLTELIYNFQRFFTFCWFSWHVDFLVVM
jgi:hypothetical protein